MIEYTREMFNSNCDIQFIRMNYKMLIENHRIESFIFDKMGIGANYPMSYKKVNKFVYDLTTKQMGWRSEQPHRQFDNELTWKFSLEVIVKELKKIFVDANIYYENKEIFDIHDNITIHRLIIIEL